MGQELPQDPASPPGGSGPDGLLHRGRLGGGPVREPVLRVRKIRGFTQGVTQGDRVKGASPPGACPGPMCPTRPNTLEPEQNPAMTNPETNWKARHWLPAMLRKAEV